MADPILPSAAVFETAAIDAIVAARPSTAVHFNNPASVYRRLPTMWRAQALTLLARLADEVKSARLKTATGDALRSLCASEFRTQLPAAPQTALGGVLLARTGSAQGVVPQGTRFQKVANPNGVPLPIPGAAYTTTAPVYVKSGQLNAYFPLQATAPGATSNFPLFTGYGAQGVIVPSQPLFDPTFTTTLGVSAAGGSSGLPDPVLVAASKAYVVGQFGPTQGAAIAGLLAQQSVRHIAAFPASSALPYAGLYVADESWADAPQWHSAVAQVIANAWTGFGCRIRFGTVANLQIAVTASFTLNKTEDLNSTPSIDVGVRATAEAYFNNRPDWYRYRLGALQQALSKADSRIRRCTNVVVTDVLTGQIVQEPPNLFTQVWSPTVTHYYLTDQNVTTTYYPPA